MKIKQFSWQNQGCRNCNLHCIIKQIFQNVFEHNIELNIRYNILNEHLEHEPSRLVDVQDIYNVRKGNMHMEDSYASVWPSCCGFNGEWLKRYSGYIRSIILPNTYLFCRCVAFSFKERLNPKKWRVKVGF